MNINCTVNVDVGLVIAVCEEHLTQMAIDYTREKNAYIDNILTHKNLFGRPKYKTREEAHAYYLTTHTFSATVSEHNRKVDDVTMLLDSCRIHNGDVVTLGISVAKQVHDWLLKYDISVD